MRQTAFEWKCYVIVTNAYGLVSLFPGPHGLYITIYILTFSSSHDCVYVAMVFLAILEGG